jgi:TP901 family phage tail tape measure protein
MGFAGQVFAARVAIGLAVPSSQALQESGGIIAKGAEKIYGRLGAIRAKHGAITASNYKKQLKDLLDVSKSSQHLLTQAMGRGVKTAYDNMSKIGQESLKGIFKKGQYKQYSDSVKGALGKDLHKKIFAGVGGLQSTAQRVQRMQKNIIKLTKEERAEALKNLEVEKNSARTVLENLKDEQASLERKKFTKGKLSKAEEKRYTDLVTKSIPAAKDDLRVADQSLRKTKELVASVDSQIKSKKDLVKAFKEVGRESVKAGQSIKAGFNDVLRNSTALVAAFTYKLNQHTQELITYERELLNANSVWGLSNQELFTASSKLIEFTNTYGVSLENAAAGMYQLASAGLTLAEAEEVVQSTLLLSMAVQGDHNTIAKLTTQIIKGYGMEMSEAARLNDMMAHAIQKSLIEWQDLSSAVKFALPFFTSTNQEIEVLIGSLMILTDRALEAGIAGRGLRQGLAEFAESAMDSEAGFAKMGIEIVNAEGEMRQLTDIALQFHEKLGEGVSNTELLTTLIQDLNVRGATAFVHLVQNAELFNDTVDNVKNSSGELQEMADIQNASISAQIEILKSNIKSIFLLGDANIRAEGYMSKFHKAVVEGVDSLTGLFIETVDGKQQLTELGKEIENLAVNGVKVLVELIEDFVVVLGDLTKEGLISADMLRLMTMPLRVMLQVLDFLGPDMLKIIIYMKVINGLLPMATLQWIGLGRGIGMATMAMRAFALASGLAVAIGGIMLLKKGFEYFGNRQSGGMVYGMSQGGMPNSQPYMVGEQGPELFVPGERGQILNTSQTRDVLAGNFNPASPMNNQTVIIEKAIMKNSTIGIDSFGGLA